MQETDILDYEKPKAEPLVYATFWERVLASVIDTLVFIPIIVLNFVNIFTWKTYLLDILLGVVYLVYKPLLEWKFGATLGKKAMGIKVVTQEGTLMDFQQSLTRFTFYFISSCIGMITSYNVFRAPGFEDVHGFLDFSAFQAQNSNIFNTLSMLVSILIFISVLFVAFDTQRRQALHDKMAKTFVVKSRKD